MSEAQEQISGIILAAGRSERMGAFKPLLPYGNSTVIESCVDYLKRAGVQHVVVVLGHRANEIRERLANSEIEFALNPDPTSEMSESIACGVQQLPSSAVATVIALTDQPAIPPAVVKSLIAEWCCGAKIVQPQFAGRGGHPVLIDLAFRNDLLQLNPQEGLRGFFLRHRSQVRRIALNSPFVARDMDTWDDYRALHQEVFGFAPDSRP